MKKFDTLIKILPSRPPSKVNGLFWKHNPKFIEQLTKELLGKRVIEVFAGNGYLASLLHARGIDIKATSVLSGMDAHHEGVYHPVEEINAVEAAFKYRDDHDVLLMAWPTTTAQAFLAASIWEDKTIAFIGEVTDYAKGHLGGCATDEFFECFDVTKTLDCYKGNDLERALIGKMGSPNPQFARDVEAWEGRSPEGRAQPRHPGCRLG